MKWGLKALYLRLMYVLVVIASIIVAAGAQAKWGGVTGQERRPAVSFMKVCENVSFTQTGTSVRPWRGPGSSGYGHLVFSLPAAGPRRIIAGRFFFPPLLPR